MELSEEHRKLIDRVAVENGFTDYRVIATPGSFKGENFMGIVTAVTVKDNEKSLELFLKSAHTSEAFRKAAPLREAYKREVYIYERVFPEFIKFQEENNIVDQFDSIPKTYACSVEEGHECFLMENLNKDGYQLWDKKTPMNSEHIGAVLKEYAKLHAVSFAMNDKNPKLFEELMKDIKMNIFEISELFKDEQKLKSYIKVIMSSGYKAVEDDVILTECLNKVETDIQEIFQKDLKDPGNRLVLKHGDCWCNNFLFKYQDAKNPTKPSSLKIIDWQISAVASPATDICYFFVAHSSKQILTDFKTYLKLYYDTLCTQLRNFHCDPEKIYPYSCLEKHVNKYMTYGLYMGLIMVKVMLCDSDEAPDFAEISKTNDWIKEGLNFNFKNFDTYKSRIKDMVEFFKDFNTS